MEGENLEACSEVGGEKMNEKEGSLTVFGRQFIGSRCSLMRHIGVLYLVYWLCMA